MGKTAAGEAAKSPAATAAAERAEAWRTMRELGAAQLYNLTADGAEEHDLATKRPADVKRLASRLAFWEAQSVEPYAQDAIDPSCGEGKPHGSPPAWSPWC